MPGARHPEISIYDKFITEAITLVLMHLIGRPMLYGNNFLSMYVFRLFLCSISYHNYRVSSFKYVGTINLNLCIIGTIT